MSQQQLQTTPTNFLDGVEIKLGVPICSSLVVGNMVGSGIFVLPATLAELGIYALIPWAIACCTALGLAIVLARLAKRNPEAGGPISYTSFFWGRSMGGVVSWSYWFSLVIGNSAVAYTFSQYFSGLFSATTGLIVPLVAIVIIWLLTLLNIRTTLGAVRIQFGSTILKIIPLAILIAVALPQAEGVLLAPSAQAPDTLAMMPMAGLLIWAFVGLESATIPADITKNPRQTIARSTIYGTAFVCGLYLLIILVSIATVPANELAGSPTPLALVATKVMGTGGNILVRVAGILCMLSALNGFILISGYLMRAAALNNFMPGFLGELSGKGNTPRNALYAGAVVSTMLILLSTKAEFLDEFVWLTALATSAMFLPYGLCCVAEMVTTWRDDHSGVMGGIGLSIVCLLVITVFTAAVILSNNYLYFGGWIALVALLGVGSAKLFASESSS